MAPRRFSAALGAGLSVKVKVLCTFGLMLAALVLAGARSIEAARTAGALAAATYDKTVVSTSYASAAATDFSKMRAEVGRRLVDRRESDANKGRIGDLLDSFRRDIALARERADARDVDATVGKLDRVVGDWAAAAMSLTAHFDPAAWAALDRQGRDADLGIELLMSQVDRVGFANRTDARSTVDHEVLLTTVAVGVAVAACGLMALAIARRITKPLSTAVRFAEAVARGEFGADAPPSGGDEFGALGSSLGHMRDHIAQLLAEQERLSQQSQARVAEALEGSAEGVLIATADGVVQIANGRVADYLGHPADAALTGSTLEAVASGSRHPPDLVARLMSPVTQDQVVEDVALPDGRWVRSSRSRTAEGGFVALLTDTTAMRAQQIALASVNANLDGALANMSQGLVVIGNDGRVVLANARLRSLLGIDGGALAPGVPLATLVDAVIDRYAGSGNARRLALHEARFARSVRMRVRSVRLGERELSITQARMPDGGWIATLADVTEQRRVESRMNHLANHDALTGLPNRTLLRQKVDEAIARARRGRAFAVLCLDLDRFKAVNDTLGHAVGDGLLREVAARLSGSIRDTDLVARLGGDEFAVLVADVHDEAGCAVVARRIVDAVSAPYTIDDNALSVGVSIGIARAPANGLDYGELLRAADAALYKSKEEGRGVYTFFADELDEALRRRRGLETDLRKALAARQLSLHYQPFLECRSKTLSGFEALMRWTHPTLGPISPAEFIPIAEETGILRTLGAWALRTACAEAARWDGDLRVAVNVSAMQLRDRSFAETVIETLAVTGLPGSRLEVEVTESTVMNDREATMPILAALREAGVSVAMDDFGTGHSSLSNLNAFPFSRIKIDRSFVQDLHERKSSQQIIRTVVMLGRTLGMNVTAEGVETYQQMAFVEEIGCDTIQGYLIGRPMPASDVPAAIAAGTQTLAA